MSLREKTVKGAKWSAISTVVSIGISFLQMTVLAHIIDTHQFGLLTISLVIMIIADTLTDFGISNSIIQRKILTEVELSTLYWVNILLGILVFCVTYFSSGYISYLLNQTDLNVLIVTLSFGFLIIPHGQQFRALLQKELEFSKIGIIETCSSLVGFVITISSAIIYPMAITAIWGYLSMITVRTILFSYVGRKQYKPKMIFRIKSVTSNLKFGAYLTADNLTNQLNSNIATFILSRMLGAVITGGYNLAYNVAVIPASKLNPIITRVLFPAFSKIQDDKDKLKDVFYKLLSLVGLLNFPALLGLIVVADNFVFVVFGNKWMFITPILQTLCIVGLLRSIGNPIGSLLMAKARVDISFKFNIFKMFLFFPFIWAGSHFGGGLGAALGFLAVQIINTILSYFILIKPVLGPSYKAYLNSIWLPFRLTLPTVISAWGVGHLMGSNYTALLTMSIQILVGLLFFGITLLLSRHKLIIEIKHQFVKSNKLRRLIRA